MVLNANYYSNCLRRFVPFTAMIPMDVPDSLLKKDIPETKKFRTLYLLHGYTGYCDDWVLGSRIQEFAAQRNLAVVMPSGGNSFYVDNQIGEKYGEFVGRELVEFTRRLFPLSHRREDTLVGGLSMGGYGALRNGLKYADTFGTIIALSSALITDAVAASHGDTKDSPESKEYYISVFGDPDRLLGSDKDPKALAKKLKDSGVSIPRIYMACGTEDFLLQPNRDMHETLEKLGIDVTYEEGPGIHDWNFWNPYIERALDWFDPKSPDGISRVRE